VGEDVFAGEGGDVAPAWNVRPMVFKDAGGMFIPFALEHGFHTSSF
jgi:hypothetical protein